MHVMTSEIKAVTYSTASTDSNEYEKLFREVVTYCLAIKKKKKMLLNIQENAKYFG